MQVGKLERIHMQCSALVRLLQLPFVNSNLHAAQNERFAVVWRQTFHLGRTHKSCVQDFPLHLLLQPPATTGLHSAPKLHSLRLMWLLQSLAQPQDYEDLISEIIQCLNLNLQLNICQV